MHLHSGRWDIMSSGGPFTAPTAHSVPFNQEHAKPSEHTVTTAAGDSASVQQVLSDILSVDTTDKRSVNGLGPAGASSLKTGPASSRPGSASDPQPAAPSLTRPPSVSAATSTEAYRPSGLPTGHPHLNSEPAQPSKSQLTRPGRPLIYPESVPSRSTAYDGTVAGSSAQRPLIVDPPERGRSPQQSGTNSGRYRSPKQAYAAKDPKFVEDCQRINYALQQSVPEAVRQAVRDNWEKCILGSEFHQAFILNASIHSCTPQVTKRGIRDFGNKMIHDCLDELIHFLTQHDLDEVADALIAKASNGFLDQCLQKRLATIEAKPLINALARAERLGYDKTDVVEDDEAAVEKALAAGPPRAMTVGVPAASPSPYQPKQCPMCFRSFGYEAAYQYHFKNSLCTRLPQNNQKGFSHSCAFCGQGFISTAGLHYHTSNSVCGVSAGSPTQSAGGLGPAPVLRSAPPAATPTMLSTPSSAPAHAAFNQRTSPSASTPVRRIGRPPNNPLAVVARPNLPVIRDPTNPYAHLTKMQLDDMNRELREAEQHFGPRFREAEAVADPNERRARVDGLRNSFGTKQSMIRKKYGVRLRERRKKAEIDAERERMGLPKTASPPAQNGPQKRSLFEAQKLVEESNRAISMMCSSAGFTPANKSSSPSEEQDAKRRRLSEGGATAAETPSPVRTALSVAQMGSAGLASSNATAAIVDPTTALAGTAAAPAPVATASASPESRTASKEATPEEMSVEQRVASLAAWQELNPPAINNSTVTSSASVQVDSGAAQKDDDMDSDSDSDAGDIPPLLPAHIRGTLPPYSPPRIVSASAGPMVA